MNLGKLFKKRNKIDLTTLDAASFFNLEDDIKRGVCQKLKIYNTLHLTIFTEVNRLFTEKHRFVKSIEASQCGLAPILGPSNCIMVFIPRRAGKVTLPRYFEGFPIIRIYENNTATYRNMVDRIRNMTESA